MMWGIGGTIAAALLILLFTLLRRVDAGILAQQKALRESDALLKKLSRQIPGVLYQYRQEPDGKIDVLFVSDTSRRYAGSNRTRCSGTSAPFLRWCIRRTGKGSKSVSPLPSG